MRTSEKKCITLRTISRKVDSSQVTIILLITTSECFYVSGGMPCILYLIHLTSRCGEVDIAPFLFLLNHEGMNALRK